jgi:hypothetical protein
MPLLRRNIRPPAPPGDWLDALQLAMRVDPALRPKRDRPLVDLPSTDPPVAREVPRRFRQPEPNGVFRTSVPGERYVPPPPAQAVERPWLVPVPTAAAVPPVSKAAAAPVLTAGLPPAPVEQLFQWVCQLSRVRRAGPSDETFAADVVRGFAELHLANIAVSGPVGLKLRESLGSFVDLVMMRADIPLSGTWRPLGPVPPERAYGLAVAEAAADPTGLQDGTWIVHHAALSLVADLLPPLADFPGGAAVLDALDVRLHGVATTTDDRICPGAYKGVFDPAIVRPVDRPVRTLAAAAVGLLLLAIAGAVLLNLRYVGQLRGSIDAVDQALHASQ